MQEKRRLEVQVGAYDGIARRLEDAQAGTRLNWSATSDVSGTVANLGPRLIEGTARMMSEQFWTDFARRVSRG